MEVEIGSVEEVKMDKSKSPVNFFECVPQEVLHIILSFLTYEQLDGIRSVNRRFCVSGNAMLKKEFVRLPLEVTECQRKARIIMLNPKRLHLEEEKIFLYKKRYCANQIFWFVADQLLGNSFCCFDIRKGYLPQEYSVSGKTLDVVRFLLWFRDTNDPLMFFVETLIGRCHRDCNMKSYEDPIDAYYDWYSIKKYPEDDSCKDELGFPVVEFIYRPVFSRKHPKLNLPPARWHFLRCIYTMTVDLISELLTQKEVNKKEHLVFPQPFKWVDAGKAKKVIQAVKPNLIEEEENYSDGSDLECEHAVYYDDEIDEGEEDEYFDDEFPIDEMHDEENYSDDSDLEFEHPVNYDDELDENEEDEYFDDEYPIDEMDVDENLNKI